MAILGIDPGNVQSAWLVFDPAKQAPTQFGIPENYELLGLLDVVDYPKLNIKTVAIEMIASYGMPVGKEVFDTCVWIGRFLETVVSRGINCEFVYRKDVKVHLCGSMKAKDSNIRQALVDRFGAPGTKKEPGVLYGVSKDVWSALGVAVTYSDTH